MKQARKWVVLNENKIKDSRIKIQDIIEIVLENRGIKTKEEVEEFLHPSLDNVTIESVGIDKKQLTKAIKRITTAIEKKEKIVVFGDYDVDGITGTAILWETLHKMGADVIPYIPHRVDEGYGLSSKGISNVQLQNPNIKLIITVDNGIVANEAVDFANKNKIDVIITDHHTLSEKVPDAFAIVHTTKLCGAAVGWMLAQELRIKSQESSKKNYSSSETESRIEKSSDTSSRLHPKGTSSPRRAARWNNNYTTEHLDLVALATVADLVPLTGANRAILKEALPHLQQTKRVGLKELFLESGINPKDIGVYEIGHIIGPRLNAMGRMESAMDSLRLLCTRDVNRAKMLAAKLGITNKERQLVTQSAALHAIERVKGKGLSVKNILFIADKSYEEGVIGLVAGKLVEEYYRPSIVLSIGETISKASARSVSGFNIIDFIRSASKHLINAGGHPMAAGFTVKTENIAILQEFLEKMAIDLITKDLLTPILKIDLEIPLPMVSVELYKKLQDLGPFGMANPEPVFMSKKVTVEDVLTLGRDKKHLKFFLSDSHSGASAIGSSKERSYQSAKASFQDDNYNRMTSPIEAIAFGIGERFSDFKKGSLVDVVYTINENEWMGRKKLQLKIREIQN